MTRSSLSMNKLSLKKWKSEIIKTVLIITRHVYSKNQIVSIIDMQKISKYPHPIRSNKMENP